MATRRCAGPAVLSGMDAEGLVGRAARTIGCIALRGLVIVAVPMVVAAQPAKKIAGLCFLIFDPGTFETRPPRWEAFFQRLSGRIGLGRRT